MYVGYCISGIHGRSSLNPLAQEALRPLHRAEVEASSMCWRMWWHFIYPCPYAQPRSCFASWFADESTIFGMSLAAVPHNATTSALA